MRAIVRRPAGCTTRPDEVGPVPFFEPPRPPGGAPRPRAQYPATRTSSMYQPSVSLQLPFVSRRLQLALDHIGHGRTQVLHTVFAHSGDIDAPAADDVDAVPVLQLIDLHRIQTAEGKHSVLRQQK